MPVIDTTFLIDLELGVDQAKSCLQGLQGQTLVVPAVVAVEYLTLSADPEDDLAQLRRGYSMPEGKDAWILVAAALRRDLHAQGAKIRIPDLWIAAWARLLKTYVVTANARHYRAMGVSAWHYPTERKPPK